jgi:release factor glutamine methyltransferase
VPTPADLHPLIARLAAAGFVAAEEEALELTACAGGHTDRLASLVERRLSGEPLAWVTGTARFCGLDIAIAPGVYVPRWQSEPLARLAAQRLPATGTAIDLCTGSGAIAAFLATERPRARVVATDLEERAVACAAANGVEVYLGDLFHPLPASLRGGVDVVLGVVPYVPTPSLAFLPRDTLDFELPLSYDGGPDGTRLLRRVMHDSRYYLRPGGALLLELGGNQAEQLGDELAGLGFVDVTVLVDEDGDERGLAATWAHSD